MLSKRLKLHVRRLVKLRSTVWGVSTCVSHGNSSLRQSSDSPPSPPHLSPINRTRPICAWIPRPARCPRLCQYEIRSIRRARLNILPPVFGTVARLEHNMNHRLSRKPIDDAGPVCHPPSAISSLANFRFMLVKEPRSPTLVLFSRKLERNFHRTFEHTHRRHLTVCQTLHLLPRHS